MAIEEFLNLFGDTEVTGKTPDAEEDWHLVTDAQIQHNYMQAKIAEGLQVMSTRPDLTYLIVYGGIVTDSGGGQIDISEGIALSSDTNGKIRLMKVPALTNVALPSGWNDNRQIWVVGQYDFKLGTPTRNHYDGTNYHYTLADTYYGDSSGEASTDSDDLFVDADPNAVADSALCWGSFTMNGTTFTEQTGERSPEYCVDGAIKLWTADTPYKSGDLRYFGLNLYKATGTHQSGSSFESDYDSGNWDRMIVDDNVGEIKMITNADTVPANAFECDGSAISRTTYSFLYNRITKDKGNFTVTIASPGVFTLNGHGLETGHCVELTTTGALPTGLSVNTNYYVIYLTANTFELATTLANAIAGTGINTSGGQSGTHSLRFCPFGISTAANFLIPDLRGISPVGSGQQGTAVWGGANYNTVLGQYIQDSLQGHWHEVQYWDVGLGGAGIGNFTNDGTGTLNDRVRNPVTDTVNGTPRASTITQSPSLSLKFIIIYE